MVSLYYTRLSKQAQTETYEAWINGYVKLLKKERALG